MPVIGHTANNGHLSFIYKLSQNDFLRTAADFVHAAHPFHLVGGFEHFGHIFLPCHISVAMVGICTGIFNGLLAKSGYIAPEIVNGVTVAAEQTAAVKGAITFGFVGLEAITGIILAVLLIFLNVEKNIDKERAEIKACREAEE